MNKKFQEKLNAHITQNYKDNTKMEPIYDVNFKWIIKLLCKVGIYPNLNDANKCFVKSNCKTYNIHFNDKKVHVTLSDEKLYCDEALYADFCCMDETVLWQVQFNSHKANIEHIFQLLQKIYYGPLNKDNFSEPYLKPLFKNCSFAMLMNTP